MYENEANRATESTAQIPQEILGQIRAWRERVVERTALPWSEHCTECVWPTCYQSCELYEARDDGRCRRFAAGMVRIDGAEGVNDYLLRISFKRWGKLWAPGNIRLRRVEVAARVEGRDHRIGQALQHLPQPLRKVASLRRYDLKKKLAYAAKPGDTLPTSFIVECYNPGEAVGVLLTMRALDERVKRPYQKLLQLEPGFQRVAVPYAEIAAALDLRSPFNIELVPDGEREVTLVFGLMDFVREERVASATAPAGKAPKATKVKCVVWDLDHTLWDGVLVEDGAEKLRLKPGVADIVKALDERGILQSVASKNNPDEALALLESFGLNQYFLCPQVSWGPKSLAVAAIAQQLNIGVDTLLFVDDSEFERHEVQMAHSDIAVLDSARYGEVLAMEACNVPVTAESRERRSMYQVEAKRQELAGGFGGDYEAFLRHCGIRLLLRPLSEETLERVHELTQRTNQMNFSGNRYERVVLRDILANPHLDTYVMEVEDRFGRYGAVGFGIVDRRGPLLSDLMFSCRIQSKRVEHAFLAHVIRKYLAGSRGDFHAHWRKTPRNAPSGQVFADLGMEEAALTDGLTRLVFRSDKALPREEIVEVVEVQATAVEHA
jgi:FkbH-like protein